MTITGGGSIERFGSGGPWEDAYGYVASCWPATGR